MNGIEIIILIVLIITIAGGVGYYFSRNQPTLKEMTDTSINKIKVNQAQQIFAELYNKDLRPIAAKKAPKREKVTEQVQSMRKVVKAHDTLVEEINNIVLEPTEVNLEVVEATKPKKRRKYYPKKKQ